MKFKIGQIVRHRISNIKFVICKCYPKKWYRKDIKYICSQGEFLMMPPHNFKTGILIYTEVYESELKK